MSHKDAGFRRIRSEQGEVASWLVLAAGLAMAALLATSLLGSTISQLADRVGIAGASGASEAAGDASPFVPMVDSAPGTSPSAPVGPAGPPPAVAAPPTEESVAALADTIKDIDKGDDLGISEGELDRIHDRLAGLTTAELNFVLGQLTDQQLERIFHNAHSSGWLSNDWNDPERDAFYQNLLRADQVVRNQLAAAISGSTEVDEGAYLAILQGLQVDVSLGDKPNGAATDAIIQGAIDADYLDGPIADGLVADGRIITVNDADYQRAWREQIKNYSKDPVCEGSGAARTCGPSPYDTAATTYLNSRGFVDRDGRLWVQNSQSDTPGTVVHEAVHGYSDNALGQRAVSLNEGVTEYFTRQALATIDDPSTPTVDEAQEAINERGYTLNYRFTNDLVSIVGEEAVAEAYFDGDIDALEDAYVAATGRPASDFDEMLDIVATRRPAPDWAAAAGYLSKVTP